MASLPFQPQEANSTSGSTLPTPASASELMALLSGMASGNERALEHFYRLTSARVFGMALYIVRCRATAQEVTEDVYVQIWQRAADYDALRGAPMGWVLTICRSRAIDSLRRKDTALVDPEPTQRPDAPLQNVPCLQDGLEAAQASSALHAALATLPPQQRQLLGLAYFRGLTHFEIAAQTGWPLGTVKSQLRRALMILREMLDGTAPTPSAPTRRASSHYFLNGSVGAPLSPAAKSRKTFAPRASPAAAFTTAARS